MTTFTNAGYTVSTNTANNLVVTTPYNEYVYTRESTSVVRVDAGCEFPEYVNQEIVNQIRANGWSAFVLSAQFDNLPVVTVAAGPLEELMKNIVAYYWVIEGTNDDAQGGNDAFAGTIVEDNDNGFTLRTAFGDTTFQRTQSEVGIAYSATDIGIKLPEVIINLLDKPLRVATIIKQGSNLVIGVGKMNEINRSIYDGIFLIQNQAAFIVPNKVNPNLIK